MTAKASPGTRVWSSGYEEICAVVLTIILVCVTPMTVNGAQPVQAPALSVLDINTSENDDSVSITIALSETSTDTVTVTAFTLADTAVAGADYYGRHETISFEPGETRQSFIVKILDDTRAEPIERFTVALGNATNAGINNATATVTIADDDGDNTKVQIITENIQVDESVGFATVQLRLSAPTLEAVSVTISTQAETAFPGRDYYGRTTRLNIAPGEVAADFTIQILNDNQSEPNETIAINLANESNNATIVNSKTQITIIDDDAGNPLTRSTFVPLQAEDHDAMQGVQVFQQVIGFISQDDWVRFDRVDFGDGATELQVKLSVPASNAGGIIELRVDDLNGALAGRMVVTQTGGWDSYQTQKIAISKISGVHDLFFKFSGNDGIANIDWFQFYPRSAPAPTTPISDTLFGMHSHTIGYNGDWPGVPFAVYRIHDTAGAFWRDVEPRQNEWNWQQFDRIVNLAETNSAELLYTLGQTPTWAALYPDSESAYGIPGSSSRPKTLQDWRDYVRAVASRYRGRIKYYEVWNEVDQPTFYQGELEFLVSMAREAQAVIKSIDSNAVVIAPSFVATGNGIEMLDQYLQLGGGEYSDVINVHFYLPGISPPEDIPSVAAAVRRVMKKNGQAEKALWNTESNFGYVQEGQLITGDDALGYVARAYLVQWHAGVARHYWYAWENNNFVGIRFVDPATGLPTAATVAYRTIQDWMIGKTMRQCSVDTQQSWTCDLVDPTGNEYEVVWNRTGTVSYQLPPRAVAIRQLTGERENVNGGDTTSISIKPVLIELRR